MSFDDVLQPRRSSGDEPSKKTSKPSNPSSPPKTSIFNNLDVQEWAKGMGLSDELTQQVIVPLVAILDKHGGRLVDTQSSEIQAATSVIGTLGEFAPLLQGAYNYFSGVRKELNDADAALLEAHNAALSATELSSLFGSEDEMVIENEAPASSSQEKTQSSTFGPEGFNPPKASNQIIASGKVDYYELMGYGSEDTFNKSIGETTTTPSSIYSNQQDNLEIQVQAKSTQELPAKQNEIIPVDTLTLENGLTPYEVAKSDTTRRIDKGVVMDSVEITQERVSDDIAEIQAMMQRESLNRKTSSKIAVEVEEMSAEEIIADMKAKARPGRGGQQTGEVKKNTPAISVSDEELASLTSNAFSIPGLEQLQQAEAAQMKASSKMDDTADAFVEEQKTTERVEESPFNQTIVPSTEIEGLKPITWEEAVQEESIETAKIEPEEETKKARSKKKNED